MTHYLVKRVGKLAKIHAHYDKLDEAVKTCMVHTKAHDGTEISWSVLSTARQLPIGFDLENS